MPEQCQISQSDFNKIRKFFAQAVMEGATGQELSNALISSSEVDEFEARTAAHIVIRNAGDQQ